VRNIIRAAAPSLEIAVQAVKVESRDGLADEEHDNAKNVCPCEMLVDGELKQLQH
jgi:hypothetical protein